jgi:hypothetical protein
VARQVVRPRASEAARPSFQPGTNAHPPKDAPSGTAFLEDLKRRGLTDPLLAVTDGAAIEDGRWRCRRRAGLLFGSQGHYRPSFSRMVSLLLYGHQPARDPFPRHPWDPCAVSDPRMVVDEFRGALIQGNGQPVDQEGGRRRQE